MLSRLEISNFYSLKDPQTINLKVSTGAPEAAGRFAPPWKGSTERAAKVVAFFGPNASGKSNVLRALGFLSWFVAQSFHLQPEAPLPYKRFNDDGGQGSPTRLAIQFAGPADPLKTDDPQAFQCCYFYEVVLGGSKGQPQRVLSESLHYWPPTAGRRVRLFERSKDGSIRAGKSLKLSGYRAAADKILRPNASLISTLAQLDHPLALMGRTLASSIVSNVFVEKFDVTEDAIVKHYAVNPVLVETLNHEIERVDFGVRKVQIQPGPNGPLALFEHQGLTTPLPLQLESHGTRAFIRIFPLLVSALQSGGIAVVDELDISIHPVVLPMILGWFYESATQP